MLGNSLLHFKYALQAFPPSCLSIPNAPGPQVLSLSSCQNPLSLQQCIQQARAGPQLQSDSQPLTEDAALQLYQHGMAILLELDSRSVQEAYFSRQQQITSEFQQWLAMLPWGLPLCRHWRPPPPSHLSAQLPILPLPSRSWGPARARPPHVRHHRWRPLLF